MGMNIKKGDTVVVLSGKDKGKQGKVNAVIPGEGKAVVEGVNMVTWEASGCRRPSPARRKWWACAFAKSAAPRKFKEE